MYAHTSTAINAGVEVLHMINIRTIKHLGMRKYFNWANALLELEQFEA